MNTDRYIGFVQGVVYAAGLIKKNDMNSEQLIKEAGFSEEEIRAYADEFDLENLGMFINAEEESN